MSEADTRAKLIDPALLKAGWSEDWITREETAGQVHIIGAGGRRGRKRIDYVLRILINGALIPVALLEAKADGQPPDAGLEQVKQYGRIHHVPLVYSSNGHQFIEHDLVSGTTSKPRSMSQFPDWQTVRDRFLERRKFDPASDEAKPLLQKPRDGDRYYQRAAVRAVLEHIARGKNRALLSLATGTGKTRIAVSILQALSETRQLRRALFVCDRTELRQQALAALHNVFGDNAAAASTRNPEKNARVVVATYQTLGIDSEDDPDAEQAFHRRHYKDDYFSHIIIDEAHRSGWGEWRAILDRNPNAVQIGLTATPRSFDFSESDPTDDQLRRDNHHYFGKPVYEYGIAQGMDDGYLAAMQLKQHSVVTAEQLEREEGVQITLLNAERFRDPITGEQAVADDLREHYEAGTLEQRLLLPDRVAEMCAHLFQHLLSTGGPHQKTLIFCTTVTHARRVAAALGNCYATWASEHGKRPVEPYAFVCTGEEGSELLPDFKGNHARAFIACTVDLISTGVDVPPLQNVVFFRYLKSPILFQQMLGRGTRIDHASSKLHFTVYDYTNASRLLEHSVRPKLSESDQPETEPGEEREPLRTFEAEGVQVRIEPDGAYIMQPGPNGLERVSLSEYRKRIAERLLADTPALDAFRERWLIPPERQQLIDDLTQDGLNPKVYRAAAEQADYDLYDILAEAAWNQTPRTRVERAEHYQQNQPNTAAILQALSRQFGAGGIEALENASLGKVPTVQSAGGLQKLGGAEEMKTLKRRLLATDAEWSQS